MSEQEIRVGQRRRRKSDGIWIEITHADTSSGNPRVDWVMWRHMKPEWADRQRENKCYVNHLRRAYDPSEADQ